MRSWSCQLDLGFACASHLAWCICAVRLCPVFKRRWLLCFKPLTRPGIPSSLEVAVLSMAALLPKAPDAEARRESLGALWAVWVDWWCKTAWSQAQIPEAQMDTTCSITRVQRDIKFIPRPLLWLEPSLWCLCSFTSIIFKAAWTSLAWLHHYLVLDTAAGHPDAPLMLPHSRIDEVLEMTRSRLMLLEPGDTVPTPHRGL